jgi:hypothetical protein
MSNSFQPVIDGTPGARFGVNSGSDRTVTLAANLGDSEHVVELYRETEGMYGLSTFHGFTAGTVKGALPASGRLVEVVGDSISAGYGNLGTELHPNWVANPACHWTAENSSWYATYAAVAGHALNAEVSRLPGPAGACTATWAAARRVWCRAYTPTCSARATALPGHSSPRPRPWS